MLAFRTRYSLLETTIMHFGTTNAAGDIQGYINNAIREALHDFVPAYFDDIVIYSNSEGEHVEHDKWEMQP